MFQYQSTIFRENETPALKTNCLWKSAVNNVLWSVAATLLTL